MDGRSLIQWQWASDLPVRGVSHSARGRRPPQLADLEVCPTLPPKMRTAAFSASSSRFEGVWGRPLACWR